MAKPITLAEFRFQQLGLVRDVLELIGRLREIQEPITSPGGLRQTIEFILHFAELLGADADVTNRLREIISDENVFEIVLGLVRFLLGIAGIETEDGRIRASFADGSEVLINAKDFLSWLPIVIQIINLIRIIRGGSLQSGL
jgi:hypothetical protein